MDRNIFTSILKKLLHRKQEESSPKRSWIFNEAIPPNQLHGSSKGRYTRVKRLLKKLNMHYGKGIKIRVYNGGCYGAEAIRAEGAIVFYNICSLTPQLLAHEYAHFLQDKRSTHKRAEQSFALAVRDSHNDNFFQKYKEVCLFLGLRPRLMTWEKCVMYVRNLAWG